MRTDFVTNSSSSSYIAFTVRSELLASILREYDDTCMDDRGNEVSYEEEVCTVVSENGTYTPNNPEDVFEYVYHVILSTEDIDPIEVDDPEVPVPKAALAIKELFENDPKKAADSIEICKWESGKHRYDEALPEDLVGSGKSQGERSVFYFNRNTEEEKTDYKQYGFE